MQPQTYADAAIAAHEKGEELVLTEELFEQGLDTADIPDPDLLIRTSGEMRISNFSAVANCLFRVRMHRCAVARL